MNRSTDAERARFEDFYGAKWADGSVLWEDGYPFDQRVYAISLYRRRNQAIMANLPRRLEAALDLGCGAGDVALLLAGRAKRVVAVDLAFVNATTTRGNVEAADTDVSVAQAGGERLPFADRMFDAVVLADVIEHVDDVTATLAEVRRVLRPGGRVVCVTPLRATLDAWRTLDWAARRIARPRNHQKLRFSSSLVRERFLGKSELGGILQDQGLTVERFQRVGFYPAPEIGGVFGSAMRRIADHQGPEKFVRTSDRIIATFDQLAKLGVLNQKQLWVARR